MQALFSGVQSLDTVKFSKWEIIIFIPEHSFQVDLTNEQAGLSLSPGGQDIKHICSESRASVGHQ